MASVSKLLEAIGAFHRIIISRDEISQDIAATAVSK